MVETELFTTTPQSVQTSKQEFAEELKNIAIQSENNGYKGTLIYSDNRLADPWAVAAFLLANTHSLLPMIALQPVYMHPYTIAKNIATMGLIYGRKISLNLVAGGFKNDLVSLGDNTGHDKRYQRLIEYTEIIQKLLQSKKAITCEGDFYTVRRLRLLPELPAELMPEYYLSGSSESAKEAARRLGAKLIEYPEPFDPYNGHSSNGSAMKGIRIGVLARESHTDAWKEARSRFPKTREGALTHQLAKKTSDSSWHKKLSDQSEKIRNEEPVYWLGPFQNYNTFCPYLVGDYAEVAEELSHYLQAGCSTCILDIPVSESELIHTIHVFRKAEAMILQ